MVVDDEDALRLAERAAERLLHGLAERLVGTPHAEVSEPPSDVIGDREPPSVVARLPQTRAVSPKLADDRRLVPVKDAVSLPEAEDLPPGASRSFSSRCEMYCTVRATRPDPVK